MRAIASVTGPWQNANGVVVATSVDDLHAPGSKLTKQTLVDEKGQMVNGRTGKSPTSTISSPARDPTARPSPGRRSRT